VSSDTRRLTYQPWMRRSGTERLATLLSQPSDEAKEGPTIRSAPAYRLAKTIMQGEPITRDQQRSFLRWYNFSGTVCGSLDCCKCCCDMRWYLAVGRDAAPMERRSVEPKPNDPSLSRLNEFEPTGRLAISVAEWKRFLSQQVE
jgi:hypothetical protein